MSQRLTPFVSAQPLVEAVAQGFTDILKIPVAQVEVKFLERTADFNPGMSPGHDAEHSVFVAYIFNDITRVL